MLQKTKWFFNKRNSTKNYKKFQVNRDIKNTNETNCWREKQRAENQKRK